MFARSRFYSPQYELTPPKNWVPGLKRVLDYVERTDIKTVDALCVEITGEYVAGRILRQILYYLSIAIRDDGGFWKSGKEWQAETGISAKQIYRRREKGLLDGFGLTIERHLAQGRVQNHYWLQPEPFCAAIAKTLNISVHEVQALTYGIGIVPDRPPCSATVSNSLTTKHNKTQLVGLSDNASHSKRLIDIPDGITGELIGAGLKRIEAERYSTALSVDAIRECLNSTAAAKIKTSRRSYLLGALNNQIQQQQIRKQAPKPPSAPVDQSWSNVAQVTQDTPSWALGTPETTTDPAHHLWNAIKNQLEMQLDRNSYISFVKDATCTGRDGNTLIITAPAHARTVLAGRLYRVIRRTAETCTLSQITEIKFEGDEPCQKPAWMD